LLIAGILLIQENQGKLFSFSCLILSGIQHINPYTDVKKKKKPNNNNRKKTRQQHSPGSDQLQEQRKSQRC
jgi:hypothetical protein